MSVDRMKARFRAEHGIMISVHRGVWKDLPENSVPAIRAAAEWDVVEVDVRLNDAGHAYFMHDQSLLRTTGWDEPANGAPGGLIQDIRLKASAGGDEAVQTDIPVPMLEDGFRALDGTSAIFDLDVKRREDLVPVAEQVAALGKSGTATLKVRVESRADIADLKALEAAFDIMVVAKVRLSTEADLSLLRALKDADQAAVELFFNEFDLLERACQIGGSFMRVGTLSIDASHPMNFSDSHALQFPEEVWGRFAQAGVGQIMTDQPKALQSYLAETEDEHGLACA